ncbi:MAG: hypothetical protein JNJ89_16445 [Rubrivivax sp.]|nr:hypothetical protein [Rubrivivax sp.]
MPQRQPVNALAQRRPCPLVTLAWADTEHAAPRPVVAPLALAAAAAAPSAPPRDYTAGFGVAQDRAATLAARRAFVALKLTFLDATSALAGAEAQWLCEQVRAAEEPVDLWLLRAPLFSSLAGPDPERRRLRQRVRRALEALFGEPQPTTAFASLR